MSFIVLIKGCPLKRQFGLTKVAKCALNTFGFVNPGSDCPVECNAGYKISVGVPGHIFCNDDGSYEEFNREFDCEKQGVF